MLGEDRRRGLQKLAAKALGKMDALALHIGAGILPQRQRLGVVAELDADLLQHRVGIGFDERKPFFVEHLVLASSARDEGQRLAGTAARALGAPRRRAAAATCSVRPPRGCWRGLASSLSAQPLSFPCRAPKGRSSDQLIRRILSGLLQRTFPSAPNHGASETGCWHVTLQSLSLNAKSHLSNAFS